MRSVRFECRCTSLRQAIAEVWCCGRARGESVHGGTDALLAGSVHGDRSYWRIMRAAAAAAKFRNRASLGWLRVPFLQPRPWVIIS